MEYLLSFSQENEDIILYHALKDVDKVFWIDVGANDPVLFSVTKFFSIRGGRGINIEPQEKYRNVYELDRPEDINLFVGISDQPGKMEIYGEGVGASMKFDNVADQRFAIVPVITLEDVCKKHCPERQDIHFLKVDVEGWEKKCLKGMDFSSYQPWIICIESVKPGTLDPTYKEWEDILLNSGYVLGRSGGCNRYYCLSDRQDLKERLKETQKINEIYDITSWSNHKMIADTEQAYYDVVNSKTWKYAVKLRNIKKFLLGET